MRKSYKVILFVIIVLIIILLPIYLCFNMFNNQKSQNKLSPSVSYDTENFKYLDFCSTSECVLSPLEYQSLKTSSNDNNIIKEVKKINSNIQDYYDKSANSQGSCASFTNVIHPLAGMVSVYTYEDEDFLNITLNGSDFDLCSQTNSNLQFSSFYYDKSLKEEITESNFKRKNNINDEKVINAIEEYLVGFNSQSGNDYSYDRNYSYHVFKDADGTMMVYFITSDGRMSLTFSLTN